MPASPASIPADASIGSAAWAEYLVDGDLAHEIDAREIPADWPTGYFARSTRKPYDPKKPKPDGEMFRLNPRAHGLGLPAYTQREARRYAEPAGRRERSSSAIPNAQKPPFVLKGDNLAAMTFWHGKLLNEWAERWVSYWTDGKGNFVTSAMEDTGTFQAHHLPASHRQGEQGSRDGAADREQLHDAAAWHERGGTSAEGERRLCRTQCFGRGGVSRGLVGRRRDRGEWAVYKDRTPPLGRDRGRRQSYRARAGTCAGWHWTRAEPDADVAPA